MDSILVLCDLTPLGNGETTNKKYIVMLNLMMSRQLCRSLSGKRVHDLSGEGLISNLMTHLRAEMLSKTKKTSSWVSAFGEMPLSSLYTST